MEFVDKRLTCRECTNEFLFTAGEQAFFRQKGLVNEPGRCPECRIRRKQQAAQSGAAPAVPTVVPIEGQPVSTSSVVREVTAINCAECGRETTVPFRPRLARPVYCSSCFAKQRTTQAAPVTVASGSSDN